jgi:hypothetical protein
MGRWRSAVPPPGGGRYRCKLEMKALKNEAALNPVETLQRELLRRQTLLDEQKPKIERFETKNRGQARKTPHIFL